MLTLSDEVNRALLRQESEAGGLLKLALHYEYSGWDELSSSEIDQEIMMDAYLQA